MKPWTTGASVKMRHDVTIDHHEDGEPVILPEGLTGTVTENEHDDIVEVDFQTPIGSWIWTVMANDLQPSG